MRDAFFDELVKLGEQDRRIMFLTGDLGYKLFDRFVARCPGRFLNMGVSEANMVGVAAGLALSGMRPLVYSIVTFATIRCLEQIRNDVCNMNLPVVVVGVGGGYAYGVNGATHHGVDDVAAMRVLPGMTVFCPCDPPETREALRAALRLDGPAYLRLGRNQEPILTAAAPAFVPGEPRVLRDGTGIAFLACGPIAGEALQAAERLVPLGLDPCVVSVHTAKPLDRLVALVHARRFDRLFVIEEHGPHGGVAEGLACELAELRDRPLLSRISAPDCYLHETGSQQFLRRKTGLDAEGIVRTVTARMGIRP